VGRVLPVERYSGDDDSGALLRQHDDLAAWVAAHGHEVVHWVRDETVSGSVNLDKRPSLGKWMKEPHIHDWEIMVVTQQDRITRDDLHWWAFVAQVIALDKKIVVLDDPSLDLSTPNGRLLAGVKATQAANYRIDVQKKRLNQVAAYREAGKWTGGNWPFGFRSEPIDGVWYRVVDPVSSKYVLEAVERICAVPRDTLRSICRDWNARGVPTPRDHQHATKLLKPGQTRQKPQGFKWDEGKLSKVLRNPALMGYATHNGEIVRRDGIPLQVSEPLVSPAKFQQLQDILAQAGDFRRGVKQNASELIGVVFCGCGAPRHFLKHKKRYRYYRCSTITSRKVPPCGRSHLWPDDTVKALIEDMFATTLAHIEIQERTYIPGQDHSQEIATLNDAIANLVGSLATAKPGGAASAAIMTKIEEYETRLESLQAQPVTPSRWDYAGTGVTYGAWWGEHTDWHERGGRLRADGVRLILDGPPAAPEVTFVLPEEIERRVQDAASGVVEHGFETQMDELVRVVTNP
jgi:site-specific DNA recombinase